jgi:hypothetical protein
MKKVHDIWRWQNTTTELLRKVKEAFPHVRKGNMTVEIEVTGFEANLLSWVESCLE